MKILFVSQHFWPENFRANDLVKGFMERGHEVTVLTGLPNYPEGKLFKGFSFFKGPYFDEYEGARIVRTPILTRGRQKGFRLILNYLSFAFNACFMGLFFCRGRFDRVFIFNTSPISMCIPGIFMGFIKRAKVFTWVLDLWPETLKAVDIVDEGRLFKLLKFACHQVYKQSGTLLLPSESLVQECKKFKPHGVEYLPQWGENLFAQTKYTDRLSEDPFHLLFAGNLGIAQDLETIIMAVGKLARQGVKIKLELFGSGHKTSWIQETLKKNHWDNFIILKGRHPIESMPQFFSKADALVVSLSSNQLFKKMIPGKLQSYLASGKPILAILEGEGEQIVSQNNCGLTARPGQIDQVTQCILEFSKLSSAELKLMGENSKKYFKQHFEREKVLSLLMQMMEEN